MVSFFLSICTQAAAKRLVSHWKNRRILFGEQRAFLPMTLAGAMKDDLPEVKQGYVRRLPNDKNGRPVLFVDRVGSTKASGYNRDAFLRTLWYHFQVLAENPDYQKKGYVFLVNLKDYCPHKCADRIGAKKAFLIIRECAAVRVKGYHSTYGSKQTPVKIVEPQIRAMQGRHIRLHLVHHYGTDEANLESMEPYGLKKEGLPAVIGGDQTLLTHYKWILERDAFESRRDNKARQLSDEILSELEDGQEPIEEAAVTSVTVSRVNSASPTSIRRMVRLPSSLRNG